MILKHCIINYLLICKNVKINSKTYNRSQFRQIKLTGTPCDTGITQVGRTNWLLLPEPQIVYKLHT